MTTLPGRCLCGKVRVRVDGDPLRVGICHCTDCRQTSGSAFTYDGVWPASRFEHAGETSEFDRRRYCRHCGSRMFSADEREAEVNLGILSAAPTRLTPSHELWVKRREAWLQPVAGAAQYDEDPG